MLCVLVWHSLRLWGWLWGCIRLLLQRWLLLLLLDVWLSWLWLLVRWHAAWYTPMHKLGDTS